jgi:general secretion pathway protein D
MRRFLMGMFCLLAALCLANLVWAADPPSPAPQKPCPDPANPAGCATPAAPAPAPAATAPETPSPSTGVFLSPPANSTPNSKDRKAAKHAFHQGLKLQQSGDLEGAFHAFEEAARLVPSSKEYVVAREMTREHLVGLHLDRGDHDMHAGKRLDGLAEFRTALDLDPQNDFAQQRFEDAIGMPPIHSIGPAQLVAKSDVLTTSPPTGFGGLHDIHYRGDARGLFTAVAASYGLTVIFDDSFPSQRVRLDLDQADFATAIRAASKVTKGFCVPLDSTVLLAAADKDENHRAFDRMGMRTFYIPGASAPADLNEIVACLHMIFPETKSVVFNAAANTVTVRAPLAILDAETRFLEQLNSSQPEVLLEVQVLEINHTYARNIGLHAPDQFNLYNIPAAAIAGLAASLGGQSITSLINQLISSGGINQAGNSTIAALLSQLQSQANSIFSQPVATFGGGLTFFGLSLDQLGAVLSLNESSVTSLDHATLRASHTKEATLKIGSRFPVLNASFSPISNSSAIAGVLGNQSYTAPFPSVNYEDLGLSIKAKPSIHHNNDVAMEFYIQIRALGGTSVNGVPIITNREYTGGIILRDGEPAAIAGMLTESDQNSLSGLPAFAQIPGFGYLASQHNKQEMADELMILITPHILLDPSHVDPAPIWFTR